MTNDPFRQVQDQLLADLAPLIAGALDFATAESSPDILLTTFVDHNELWLAGKDTIEIWQNTGAWNVMLSSGVSMARASWGPSSAVLWIQ